MSVFQGSVAFISNSYFFQNTATRFGGTLIIGFATVTADNCSFYSNSAEHGGVIKVGNSSVKINNSIFVGNTAYVAGGVRRLDQSSKLNVNKSIFTHNTASFGGVIISKRTILLTLKDSIFLQNQVRGSGGVIFIVQSQIIISGICNLTIILRALVEQYTQSIVNYMCTGK